jgi:tetratricopeptide (TPR) repeat protein
MKQYLISIVIIFAAFAFGCSSKPAETNVNAGEVVQQQAPSTADMNDAAAALAEGNRLMDDNDTEKAIEAYRRAIELNPELPEPYFKLGIAYALVEMQMEQEGRAAETVDSKGKTRSEKQFEKAVDVYKKWLDKNPDDDVAHYNLGRTYNKLFKDDEAAKEFKLAVKLKPEDTDYQTELGGSLIRLAQYHEAIQPLKKAIEIDPGNERAISMLEDAQAGRQRLDYAAAKNKNAANSNNTVETTNRGSRPSNSNSNTGFTLPGNTNTQPKTRPTPASTPRPK